ncbi:MAG: hypothetical protein ABI627_08755 [Polyangiaceae bacterium]
MTIDPAKLLEMVALTIPNDLHRNMLVVGSLAAAYYHRSRLGQQAVNTKDADVIVHPAGAVDECAQIAKRLLAEGWRRTEQCFPQKSPFPVASLRAIRLHPPQSEAFFIELLGLPTPGETDAQTWVPCKLDDGWYGMPCFRFMTLLGHERHNTTFGIQHASPALMALANLLSHPALGTARMSAEFEGKKILRSAKDLGRVLALAWLEPQDLLETWQETWTRALLTSFSGEAPALAERVGAGLNELLGSQLALREAHVTTNIGLLGGLGVTTAQLEIQGRRLMQDVIEPFAARLVSANF